VRKVGVKPVRELLGVIVSEGAARGILVTSGVFTEEAWRFARQNPQIELVDGPALLLLIRAVQAAPTPAVGSVPATSREEAPLCPSCRVRMVIRTARRGPDAGSQFWACPRFPDCRQTMPLQAQSEAR
jgi:restriction system protein